MSLRVEATLKLGAFTLDARFASHAGVTALFGPSGSGKSTLVNIIGGLIRPDHGRIEFDDEVLVDTERGIYLPKHRRRFGYVFQEARLFPHLSVRRNLLFGRWFAPPSQRRGNLGQVVELLGIGHLLDRRPAALSGGEKQRVAIGRALLSEPRLLLMDEPLAALDEARKAEILPYLERLRDETRIPIVYVSHSLAEVSRLASTIVVLVEGRTAAVGSADQVLTRPELVAATGRAESGAVIDAKVAAHDPAHHMTVLDTGCGQMRVPLCDQPPGSSVRVRIPARDVMIALAPPQGLSALNVLEGQIAEIGAPADGMVDIRLLCGGQSLLARLTTFSREMLDLRTGMPVYAVVKSVALNESQG
ncbi:molybdenum ABC transporter ATP-binding protein [Xanthobacter sp. DSM 24535]|uniref:molybdenum ABC transporter ATP-binding protein n=1 Tax=Roseixanthobacter psychrophilus TaxID=3119917 RepID=UPI0037289171